MNDFFNFGTIFKLKTFKLITFNALQVLRMKKVHLIFLITLFVSLSSFIAHKFYVSVTQIEYKQEQQSLQMISRVFMDDMEDLIKERYDKSITIDNTKENQELDQYLKKYFDQKLKIMVNGQTVSFTFIGKEFEDDLIIVYLEIENIPSLETIKISNEVLMDLFEEQQNIVHVKNGHQRKSLILEKGKSEGVLNFSE